MDQPACPFRPTRSGALMLTEARSAARPSDFTAAEPAIRAAPPVKPHAHQPTNVPTLCLTPAHHQRRAHVSSPARRLVHALLAGPSIARVNTRTPSWPQGLVARKLMPTVPNALALDACGAPLKTSAFQVISNSEKPAATTVASSSASSRAPAIQPVHRSISFLAPSGTSRSTRMSPI